MESVTQLRERIANGESVFGTFVVEMQTPAVARVLKNSGLDFMIVDTEHGYFDPSVVAGHIAAGKQAGLCPIVRVPGPDRGIIHRTLDVGAEGILVPMSRTMDDVRQAVSASKYAPVGKRGVHLLRPTTQFNPPADGADHMDRCNAGLITGIQIETREAVELTEQIAATEGVDMLYIGPGDLSTDYGARGRLDEELFMATAARVGEACRAHGKIAGTHFSRVESLPRLTAMGFRLFGWSAALRMFWYGARDLAAKTRAALSRNGQ